MVEPDAGQAFAEAALGEEIFFEAQELAVDEVVGLVDQADREVGDHLRRAGFDERAVVFEGLRCLAAELADAAGFFRLFVPDRKVAGAEEIAMSAGSRRGEGGGGMGAGAGGEAGAGAGSERCEAEAEGEPGAGSQPGLSAGVRWEEGQGEEEWAADFPDFLFPSFLPSHGRGAAV